MEASLSYIPNSHVYKFHPFLLGEMIIENFFKECTNEIIDNMLLKLNGVSVSRGIMTLTSSLEMQVYRYINSPLVDH